MYNAIYPLHDHVFEFSATVPDTKELRYGLVSQPYITMDMVRDKIPELIKINRNTMDVHTNTAVSDRHPDERVVLYAAERSWYYPGRTITVILASSLIDIDVSALGEHIVEVFDDRTVASTTPSLRRG